MMPRIIPVTAIGLALGVCVTAKGPGATVGATVVASVAENSGNSVSSFQSVVPSSRTLVCALARPSATHWRNWSKLIGPYSRPSAPMIRYIGFLPNSPFQCRIQPKQSRAEQQENSKLQRNSNHQAPKQARLQFEVCPDSESGEHLKLGSSFEA